MANKTEQNTTLKDEVNILQMTRNKKDNGKSSENSRIKTINEVGSA